MSEVLHASQEALVALDGRVTQLTTQVQTNATNIAAEEDRALAAEAAASAKADTAQELAEETSADLTNEISRAQAKEAEIVGSVSTLSGNVATLSGNVSTLTGTVSTVASDLEINKKKVDDETSRATAAEAALRSAIGSLVGVEFVVCDTLPDTGEAGKIYLVPSASAATQNVKDEYIWVSSTWEQIGSTSVDLSNYSTTEQMNSAISTAVGGVTPASIGAAAASHQHTKSQISDFPSIPTKTSELTNDGESSFSGKYVTQYDIAEKLDMNGVISTTTYRVSIFNGTDLRLNSGAYITCDESYPLLKDFDGNNEIFRPNGGGTLALTTDIVQADWNTTDTAAKSYIKNKPDVSTKLDSTSCAAAFSTTTAYAVGDYCTYNGKLYRFKAAHSAGAWSASDVDEAELMDADATLQIDDTSKELKVVDASGSVVWSSAAAAMYDVNATSSATPAANSVQYLELSGTAVDITIPTVSDGKACDFVIDVYASAATSGLGITNLPDVSLVATSGTLADMLTFAEGEYARLTFTGCAFKVNSLPTYQLSKTVLVDITPSTDDDTETETTEAS